MAGVIAAMKKQPRYFRTEVTVDVEIDPDDLHADGWHHESECKPAPPAVQSPPPSVSFADAVASLHRQAHPSQLPSVAMCTEDPCRWLTLDQLRGAAS